MKVAIGADHAGYEMKEVIKRAVQSMNITVEDFGTDSVNSVDYPDFAHPVAQSVEKGQSDLGIVICGSGNGVNMVVNKHTNVRGALCWNKEIAVLARQHNNANVLALPARFVSEDEIIEIVKAFLTTEFEGGRHQNRVSKI